MTKTIIIGIDPGTRVTGYGIVQVEGNNIIPLDFGCIKPPPSLLLSDRYFIIYEGIEELISQYGPHEMAIETPFMRENPQSALKLGMAHGICLIPAKKKKMKVYGYSPRDVKCSIAGTGKASKEQLQGAIQRMLGLKKPPTPYDAADALAIAVCHANRISNPLERAYLNEA